MSSTAEKDEKILHGVAVSPGIARGQIFVSGGEEEAVTRHPITPDQVPSEIGRLEQALLTTRQQILEIRQEVSQKLGTEDASIFDAHLMVVEDVTLVEQVVKRLQKELYNVEAVFADVAEKYAKTLAQSSDTYLRERATDIRDVSRRILRNLIGKAHEDLRHLSGDRIVVAYDLAPSDTAALDRARIKGFATDIGSRTSHTAIMARALEIPAVVGLHDASRQLHSGMEALLDGYQGLLIIHPSAATLQHYVELEQRHARVLTSLEQIRDLPAQTRDGRRIVLSANMEQLSDLPSVLEHGVEGVGLYRTEYLFLNRDSLPTEEEQYQAYVEVARAVKPHSVIIRTLDLGGDKFLSHLDVPQEMNPFLGWRAIRFCLERMDIFKAQLRAILRASAEGNVRMMYPMVSGLHELKRANAALEECMTELCKEGKSFNQNLEVGAMIEVPSAALIADALVAEADFFSIGTNDLIQYALAVDRVNEKIAHLYEPTHPAILKLIYNVVQAAHAHGLWVGVCGEMAGEPVLVPVLVGLGVDELSTDPATAPRIKMMIRSLHLLEAQALAQEALKCRSGRDVFARTLALARKVAPEVLEITPSAIEGLNP